MSNPNGTNARKALNLDALNQSIQSIPKPGQMRWLGDNGLLMRFGEKASDAPEWWRVHQYDAFTENFWPTEPFLASAVATVASQYSARTWFLDGPKRAVKTTMDMLESADNGRGMVSLFLKLIQDLKTRNNGAFLGLPRDGFDYAEIASRDAIERYKPAEKALKLSSSGRLPPVVGLEHLDSSACWRTGDPLYPVLYRDPINGNTLYLPWHMVVPMAELPHPKVRYGGIQLCAVSRVLRAAQIIAAHEIYKLEKITGRSPEDMILFTGVNRQEVRDQLAYGTEQADNENLLRWQDAALVFGINPERPATATTLSLKSTGGFGDMNAELQWYITVVALGFLETYQTFAPLQSGNLGNSQQSIILAEGAAGKGPALWEKMITQIMHQYAIVPRNCTWRFGEKSIRYETDLWNLTNTQMDAMIKLKRDLEVPAPVVYQIMADNAIILNDEYLAMLGERDQTDNVTVADDDQDAPVVDVPVADVVDVPTLNDIIEGDVKPSDAPAAQGQALNGAQVASLLEIVGQYAAGTLSITAARAIIAASFPMLSRESIDAILSNDKIIEQAADVAQAQQIKEVAKSLARLRATLKAEQPRADDGRFGEGGGGASTIGNGKPVATLRGGQVMYQSDSPEALERDIADIDSFAKLSYTSGPLGDIVGRDGSIDAEALESSTVEVNVVRDEAGEAVGYAVTDAGVLYHIEVRPDQRGQGLARQMIGQINPSYVDEVVSDEVARLLDDMGIEYQDARDKSAKSTLKSLRTLYHTFKASQAEGIVAEFEESIFQAMTGYIDGLRKSTQQARFIAAINVAWPAMAEVCYENGGGDWAEVDEETAQAIEDLTIEQVNYAVGFWDDLPDIRDEGRVPDARTSLYVNSLRGLCTEFMARGAGNPMLTFILGDAEEHCENQDGKPGCLDLNGTRYSFRKWQRLGVTPGAPGSSTTCGGFNCQCWFENSDGEKFGVEG